jgi:putative hydrolase of the HAD superfamily
VEEYIPSCPYKAGHLLKAVFFDAGGVLHTSQKDAEQEQFFIEASRAALGSCGIFINADNEEYLKRIEFRAAEYKKWSEKTTIELSPADIWRRYFLKDFAVDPEQLATCAEFLCYLYDGKKSRITPRPDLLETIRALHNRGLRLGVISNTISKNFIPGCLKKYGIASYMETVILSSVEGRRKPAVEIFQTALAALKLEAGECAFVGDRLSRDVIGAKSAGFGCVIQIRHPHSIEMDKPMESLGIKPDVMIDGLAEIPAIVDSFKQGG